jgi:hypothetical protein
MVGRATVLPEGFPHLSHWEGPLESPQFAAAGAPRLIFVGRGHMSRLLHSFGTPVTRMNGHSQKIASVVTRQMNFVSWARDLDACWVHAGGECQTVRQQTSKKPSTRGANDADPRVDPLIGCIIMDLIYRRLLLNDDWDQGDAGDALMERLTHRVQEQHRQFRTSMTQEQANEQISLCLGHPLSSLSVLEIVDKVSAHNLHRTSEIERYKRLIESHQQAIRELEAEKALAADSARPAPTRSRAALGRRPRRNQAPQAGGGGDLEK